MRIDADLNGVDAQFAKPARFRFVDHHRVRLDFDVEHQTAGVFDKLEEIARRKPRRR